MLSYKPSQDPAGEVPELFDSMSTYSLHDPGWNHFDPHLGSMNHCPDLSPYDWAKNYEYAKDGRYFTAYDRNKHGFGLGSHDHQGQQQHGREHGLDPYQLGLNTAWHGAVSGFEYGNAHGYGHGSGCVSQESARTTRYLSPTDGISLTGSTSSSDSAFSDYACSPDGGRGVGLSMSTAFANVYHSPMSEYGHGRGREMFSPVYTQRHEYERGCGMQMQALTGVRGSPTACSMKEVQYTPDTEDGLGDVDADVNVDADAVIEVEVEVEREMDDNEIKIKAHSPEELGVSEDTSPHDSGLGRSVETMSLAVSVRGGDEVEQHYERHNDDDDDEEEADVEEEYNTPKEESDDDEDFTPHRRARGSLTGSGGLRSSLRTPKRTASKSFAIQDEDARVHKSTPGKSKKRKPASSKRTNNTSTSSTSTSSKSKPAKTTKSSRTSTSSKATKATYPCPFHTFGCTSSFPSKNEWKRHTISQHLQLDYYRCDLGVCSESHESGLTRSRGWNDFGRKDLFVQHVRRMHRWDVEEMMEEEMQVGGKGRKGVKVDATGDVGKEEFERCVDMVRRRCWRRRRDGPGQLRCGVVGCRMEFGSKDGDEEEEERGEGAGAGKTWEERMEHMAKHYERDRVTVEEEGVDVGLRQWAVREGVVNQASGLLIGLVVDEVEGGDVKGREGVRRARRGGGYGLRGSREDDIDVDVDDNVEERGMVDEEEKDQIVLLEEVAAEYNDTDAEGEDDE